VHQPVVRETWISPDNSSRFIALFRHMRLKFPELDLHVVVWIKIAVADLRDFPIH
jgi:hypothetical protein